MTPDDDATPATSEPASAADWSARASKVSSAAYGKVWLREWVRTVELRLADWSLSDRCYLFLLGAGGMLFLAWMVGLGRFRLYEGLGGLVLSLWMSVVLLDVVDFYEAHASKGILKLLALVLAAMAGNLLLSQASLEVNGITAEDPSKFPRTVAFAMVCGFPLALGLFAFIAMMAQIAVLPFVGVIAMIRDFGISRDLSKTDRRRRIFLALRYFSSLVVSALVWQWTQQIHSAYEDTINGVVESFLFKAEMYDNSNCTMKRGERVAFLPDHKVLAGIRVGSGYHFTERACRPGNGAEDDHGQ